MKNIVNIMVLSIGSLLIAACSPIPIAEVCDNMDRNIAVEGYLSLYTCGAVIDIDMGDFRQVCIFWLYERSDQQGQRLWIDLKPNIQIVGSLESQIQRKLCANDSTCSLDGTSQFEISGHVKPNLGDEENGVCALITNDFEDIRYKP